MAKRIKRVFSSSDEVIHMWANQVQDSARSRNVFFEGNKIYSYGYHYELGRIITYNGHRVALINATGYSRTTNKHIDSAWRATNQYISLEYVEKPAFGTDKGYIEQGIRYKQKETVDYIRDRMLERNPCRWMLPTTTPGIEIYAAEAVQILRDELDAFNSLCKKLDLTEYSLPYDQDFLDIYRGIIKESVKKQVKRVAYKQSPEYIEKRTAEAIEKWRKGGPRTTAIRNLPYQLLRVLRDEVITSGGARVPLSHASLAVAKLKANTLRVGERIGHYTVSSIHDDFIKIGCHKILKSEVFAVLGDVNPPLQLVGV